MAELAGLEVAGQTDKGIKGNNSHPSSHSKVINTLKRLLCDIFFKRPTKNLEKMANTRNKASIIEHDYSMDGIREACFEESVEEEIKVAKTLSDHTPTQQGATLTLLTFCCHHWHFIKQSIVFYFLISLNGRIS